MNINDIDFSILKEPFFTYLGSLQRFHFYFLNPLFWAFILLLFFILLRFWEKKKSFSFSLVVATILLGATKLESIVGAMLRRSGETFDPLIIRMPAVFIIFIIFLYYALLRN